MAAMDYETENGRYEGKRFFLNLTFTYCVHHKIPFFLSLEADAGHA